MRTEGQQIGTCHTCGAKDVPLVVAKMDYDLTGVSHDFTFCYECMSQVCNENAEAMIRLCAKFYRDSKLAAVSHPQAYSNSGRSAEYMELRKKYFFAREALRRACVHDRYESPSPVLTAANEYMDAVRGADRCTTIQLNNPTSDEPARLMTTLMAAEDKLMAACGLESALSPLQKGAANAPGK